MAEQTNAANLGPTIGLAALSICESLLISLMERGYLDTDEATGLLEDAAAAQRHAAKSADDPGIHTAVADLIDGLKNGGNSSNIFRRLSKRRVQRNSV